MSVKPGEHHIADFTFLYHKTQYKSMNRIEFCVPQDFNKYFLTPYSTCKLYFHKQGNIFNETVNVIK